MIISFVNKKTQRLRYKTKWAGRTTLSPSRARHGDEPKLLREIGIDGEILYTPGHTDDSITILISNGDAFVGDAAMNFLGFCRIKYRPIVYRSIDDVYRSWELIIER